MTNLFNHGKLGGRAARTSALCLLALAAALLQAREARAQWSAPDAAGNISNTNTGNVGIGTTTPDFAGWGPSRRVLTIRGAGERGVLELASPSTGASGIASSIVGMNGGARLAQIDITADGAPNSGSMEFYTWNAGVYGQRMKIDRLGNIGIGTTSPLARLEVGGQADNLFQVVSTGSAATDTVANFASALGSVMIVRGNGNVGIGTMTPDFMGWGPSRRVLTIRGAGERGVLELASPSTGASGVASSIVGMNGGARLAQIDITADGAPNSGSMQFYTWNAGSYGERLRIDRSGNLGVGTSTPAAKLHVAGDILVDGNISAKYQDVAEWVPSKQKLAAGTVVVLDTAELNHVQTSGRAYDTAVAGVISPQPGISLGEKGEGKVLVATTGRVKVRVDATRGAIKVGDLLVTSDVAGVAMKSQPLELGGVPIHRPGTIIGKALEPLASGTGEILVLLSLQ